MEPTEWERRRAWSLTRRFVYYLVEDFIPPDWLAGTRAVDFSGGLGDLADYMIRSGATSVTVTVPDASPRPPSLVSERVEWRNRVTAATIAESFPAQSIDLFAARMVFQFPTWEGDRADPDSMLSNIAQVLAPGGQVVFAVHDFFPLHPPGIGHHHHIDRHLDNVAEVGRETLDAGGTRLSRVEAERLLGLVEMVRFLGLPPREGPLGETGFGLKVPMLIESMLRAGLEIEHAEHIEPFTYPVGIGARISERPEDVAELGDRVMEIKRGAFGRPEIDPYQLPGLIRSVVREVAELVPIVSVPIVRIVGRR